MKLPRGTSILLGAAGAALMAAVAIALILIGGCAQRVTVDEDRHFMAPTTWDINGDGLSVGIYNGDCCCIAGKVADTIAARANREALQWYRMADHRYADSVLKATCIELGGQWHRPRVQ